eukprot:m.285932 g.285932  ORF g.285932 m.285932 type:complete len:143 (+) comp54978_c0_seq15:357-785(+)
MVERRSLFSVSWLGQIFASLQVPRISMRQFSAPYASSPAASSESSFTVPASARGRVSKLSSASKAASLKLKQARIKQLEAEQQALMARRNQLVDMCTLARERLERIAVYVVRVLDEPAAGASSPPVSSVSVVPAEFPNAPEP